MLSIAIGVLVIAGVGAYVFLQKTADDAMQMPDMSSMTEERAEVDVSFESTNPDMENEEEGSDNSDATAGTGSDSSGGITAAMVAEHSSRSSCWSSINGGVYDLTSWIPNHPGGEQAILGLCGTDGSAKFNGKHGGQSKQLSILAGFKIGVLAQ